MVKRLAELQDLGLVVRADLEPGFADAAHIGGDRPTVGFASRRSAVPPLLKKFRWAISW